MDVDFDSCPGTLIISMIKYPSAIIEEWPKELKEYTPNPHQDYLFVIRPDDDPKGVSTRGDDGAVSPHYSTVAVSLSEGPT